MSYNIGQFRKPQLQDYSISLEGTFGTITTISTVDSGITFTDTCYNLSDNNTLSNTYNYYLRFGVTQPAKNDGDQTFELKLRKSNSIDAEEQVIDSFFVPESINETQSIFYFETIIKPNDEYNQIAWILKRTREDYTNESEDSQNSRKVAVTIPDNGYTRLINVIGYLQEKSYSNLAYITKIGVQGPPSFLMCINGEQIRIGRNGIYELNDDRVRITEISFVPKDSYFIMDFEYETN